MVLESLTFPLICTAFSLKFDTCTFLKTIVFMVVVLVNKAVFKINLNVPLKTRFVFSQLYTVVGNRT